MLNSLFQPGWYMTHDGIFHIRRASEMYEMLRLGYFPVRWGLTLDNGYGVPLFNYIYPLPYYLAALLHFLGIGIPTALKLITIFSFSLGGVGWYLLLRKINLGLSLTLALIYLMTPYQLVNIFVRGSIGETIALGIAPWILLMNERVLRLGLRWYTPLPIFFLLISHNFAGILISLAVLTNILFSNRNISGKKSLLKNFSLGVLLASFFLVPMLFEQNLLLSTASKNYSFSYKDHFVYPLQLLYSKWDYWYSMPGTENDGMTFQLGFANLFLLFFVFLISIKKRIRPKPFLVICAFSLFMTTHWSKFIWDRIVVLAPLQFPWRLLILSTVLLPATVLDYSSHLKKIPARNFFFSFLIVLAIINTRNYKTPMKFLSSDEFQTLSALYVDKTTTSYRGEIVPVWSRVEKWQRDVIRVSSGSVQVTTSNPGDISFVLESKDPQVVTIEKNFSPQWKGSVDGQYIELTPNESGEITLTSQAGKHAYRVYLSSTPLESASNILSLAGVALLIFTLLKNKQSSLLK